MILFFKKNLTYYVVETTVHLNEVDLAKELIEKGLRILNGHR